MCICAVASVWRSKDNFQELVLFFLHVEFPDSNPSLQWPEENSKKTNWPLPSISCFLADMALSSY